MTDPTLSESSIVDVIESNCFENASEIETHSVEVNNSAEGTTATTDVSETSLISNVIKSIQSPMFKVGLFVI